MCPESLPRKKILQTRAQLFERARAFFSQRGVLEVDCPALSCGAPIDVHIDVMPVALSPNRLAYLFTSPEYGMKQLLASGAPDIYQMGHVFRLNEVGPLHQMEFTMVEWYRRHLSFQEMIEETLDFIRLFLGELPTTIVPYRTAFQRVLEIDPFHTGREVLLSIAGESLPSSARDWDVDTLLQFLFQEKIEPALGKGELTVIAYFPSSQAALAKTRVEEGELVALRFEIYYKGIELANGYDELIDHQEQRRRLEQADFTRVARGKESLPLDLPFLAALERGLPSCRGVAVGFDRLVMLKENLPSLADALPLGAVVE